MEKKEASSFHEDIDVFCGNIVASAAN